MGLFGYIIFVTISLTYIHISAFPQGSSSDAGHDKGLGVIKKVGKEIVYIGDNDIDNIEEIFHEFADSQKLKNVSKLIDLYGDVGKRILNSTDITLDDTDDAVGGIAKEVEDELFKFAGNGEDPRKGFVKAVKNILYDIANGVEGVLGAFIYNIKALADSAENILMNN